MFKVESIDRELPKNTDMLGYYFSLERHLAKEYSRLGDLTVDKFAQHLLHLMGNTSIKNAELLRETFDELSKHGLVERPTEFPDGWANISPGMDYHRYAGDDLQQSLRKYLAFEEYLEMEYRVLAEYLMSAAQKSGIPISGNLSTIAKNHEEYYCILKNLIKITDMDEMLVGILR